MKYNYELPIKFGALMKPNTDLPTCDLKKSIMQNINLIITSKYNEHRFDESYGCEIWDMDFERILNDAPWRDKISKSITQSLNRHELRIEQIDVSVEMKEEEFVNSLTGIKGIRKKITILVPCVIKETGEQLPFRTWLYMGPLSID